MSPWLAASCRAVTPRYLHWTGCPTLTHKQPCSSARLGKTQQESLQLWVTTTTMLLLKMWLPVLLLHLRLLVLAEPQQWSLRAALENPFAMAGSLALFAVWMAALLDVRSSRCRMSHHKLVCEHIVVPTLSAQPHIIRLAVA